MVYSFFLLGWLYFLLQLSRVVAVVVNRTTSSGIVTCQLLYILTIVILVLSLNTNDLRKSNLFNVVKSLTRGIPQTYHKEQLARYSLIRNTPPDSVAVPPIRTIHGNPLYLSDLNKYPYAPTNHYYAIYWGKRIIHVDTTGAKK
jgi:hypothetical protein